MEDAAVAELLQEAFTSRQIPRRPDLQAAVESPQATLYCPTRRAVQAYPLRIGLDRQIHLVAARTDYAMNGGGVPNPSITIRITQRGVWIPGRRVAPKEITDGLTRTYLIGEKTMDPDKYETGDDYGDWTPYFGWQPYQKAMTSYVRYGIGQPFRDRLDDCISSCHSFGSAHTAGWNAAMADGSVRTVTYGASPAVHFALSTISGSETFDPE